MHTEGGPEPQRKADRVGEARTAAGGRGFLQGATGPGRFFIEEEERTQPDHSRRAEAPLSPAPTEPPERPRGEDSPGKGRSKGGQGKQQA